MPVRDKEVEPTVIVVVEKASTEAENIFCGTGDACLIANFFKGTLSVVVPDMVRRFLKIRDIQVEPAIVIVVAKRDTHGSHGAAARRESHTAEQPNFVERPIVFIMVEIGIQSVVGHEQVRPAIVIVVGGSHREILTFRLVDPRYRRCVGEGSIAIIVIENVSGTFVNAGWT